MPGLISNIHSLDEPELAEDLSIHLTVVKSLLNEHNQTTISNEDAFVTKVAAFYVTTRDATQVQLRQQIADEIACLENISQQVEQLTVSLEE